MRTLFIGLAALALALTLSFTANAGEYPPQFWKNDQDGWVVETKECGGALCAFLVAFRMVHQHLPGYAPLDEKNSNPARRADPLCGLQLIGGFRPGKRTGSWEGGWVYDPDSGRTYSGTITQVDEKTAKLRAYIGFSLLGKTLMLRRVAADDAPRCTAPGG